MAIIAGRWPVSGANLRGPRGWRPRHKIGALQQITVQKRAVVGGRGMRRGHAMLRRPEGATVDEVASQRLDARFGLQPSGGDQMLYRSSLDSPLEGDGFELLVPRHKSPGFPQHSGRAPLLTD